MGFVVKAVKSVVKAVTGVVSKVIGGVFGFSIGGTKAKKTSTPSTLNKQLEPETYKKAILGKIAAPLDLRYWEVYGSKGERFVEIIALACHRVNAILETYFETDLAFSAGGIVQGKYAGVVTRNERNGAFHQSGYAVGSGTRWTSAATMDGCAYVSFDWLPDEKKLPNGIPTRITQVTEGAPVYDPRRDSTVTGGSGPHRINDRNTWAYATLDGNGQPIGRNNALQALWYLLGWKVPTKDVNGNVIGEMLVFGRDVLPEDINISTFIAGANACEIAGYYTDVVLSSEDDHTSNEDAITCDGLIGRLIDPGGLWSYYANVDDTANVAVELTDTDVLEGTPVNWDEYKGIGDQFNQVRGKFVNPSSTVLFQAFPYPMVRDVVYETNLGVKKAKTQDFKQVLDGMLAQRLARLLLNQGQYQGEFSAGFNYRAARAQAWSVVRYTSERFNWSKLFRVWRHDISTNGGVTMLLREIHPSIWGAGTVTPPGTPGIGLRYDPRQEIAPTGVQIQLYSTVTPDGTKADGFRIRWDLPPTNVRRTEVRYKLVSAVAWEIGGPVERDVIELAVSNLFSGSTYEAAVRHISIHEIPGPWIAATTAPANAQGQFVLGTTGNVNAAAIANVIPAGFQGQGWFATENNVDFEDNERVYNKGRVSKLAITGKPISNRTFQTTNMNYSARSRLAVPRVSYVANGSNWNANFEDGAIYPDSGDALLLNSATHGSLAPSSTYHRHLFMPDASSLSGASYGLSLDAAGSQGSDKVYLGSITTPASGSTPPTNPEPPNPNDCVAAYAWVETSNGFKRARDIIRGDLLRVLTFDRQSTEWIPCEANSITWAEAVRQTTMSGVPLDLSITTPMTLEDGSHIDAPNAWMHKIPSFVDNLMWENCKVEPIGKILVAHISCYARVYAAGNIKGKSILTHNITERVAKR